jgi:hypothetical protein
MDYCLPERRIVLAGLGIIGGLRFVGGFLGVLLGDYFVVFARLHVLNVQ